MSGRAHFLIAAISAASLIFIVRLVRAGRLRAKYSILWLSIGVVMALLAISPQLLDRLSKVVGIDYAPATFFLTAIVLLLLICVHFSWELSRLEDRVRTLAEEIAFLNASESTKKPTGKTPGQGQPITPANFE